MAETSCTPALANTRSTRPSSAATRSAAAVTALRSVTSSGTASAVPPSAVMRSTSASRLSLRRAATATFAPSRANRSAVASPIPLDAPVTTAVRPVSGVDAMTVDMTYSLLH